MKYFIRVMFQFHKKGKISVVDLWLLLMSAVMLGLVVSVEVQGWGRGSRHHSELKKEGPQIYTNFFFVGKPFGPEACSSSFQCPLVTFSHVPRLVFSLSLLLQILSSLPADKQSRRPLTRPLTRPLSKSTSNLFFVDYVLS